MISAQDKTIIRELQGCIPLETCEPYAEIAARLNLPEADLLRRIEEMKQAGIIRRLGAVLYHQNVGKTHNVMVVWRAAGEKMEELAGELCKRPEVSHCYEREPRDGWPYNLYAMMHCDGPDQARAIVEEVSEVTGVREYRLLPSTREFKKESPVYF